MNIAIPESVEQAVLQQARLNGVPAETFLQRYLEQHFVTKRGPLQSFRGILAEFRPAPTESEITENRRDMVRGSIFDPDVM